MAVPPNRTAQAYPVSHAAARTFAGRTRFAGLGEPNLSRIDRFWRSMKEEYGRALILYRPIASIRRDLDRYAVWHGRERPHEGLRLRTPDEVFLGRGPRQLRRIETGRLVVGAHAGNRRLPVFRQASISRHTWPIQGRNSPPPA